MNSRLNAVLFVMFAQTVQFCLAEVVDKSEEITTDPATMEDVICLAELSN